MKKIILVSLLVALPVVVSAQTMTPSQIQALINSLMQQVQQLQAQLTQLQAGGSTAEQWCHDFNTNLGIGSTGAEVTALTTALTKEGFTASGSIYDEPIASAVSGFQEKYASDILAPAGVTSGTGYAGVLTRAKLNKLYGCAVAPIPPSSASSVQCTLSVSGSPAAYSTGQLTWTGTSNPTTGYKVKWFGTKNGVQDENGTDYGQTTNFTVTDGPWASNSFVGDYTRYFQGYDSTGNAVCKSNTVNTSIVAVNTPSSANICKDIVAKTGSTPVSWMCNAKSANGNSKCLGTWGIPNNGSSTTGETVGTMNITDMNPSKTALMCDLFKSVFKTRFPALNNNISNLITQRKNGPNAGLQFIIKQTGDDSSVFMSVMGTGILSGTGVALLGLTGPIAPLLTLGSFISSILTANVTEKGMAEILTADGRWMMVGDYNGQWFTIDHGTWSTGSTLVSATHSLTVNKSGTGAGTVTSADGKINCGSGADCSATYNESDQITLTAAADSGSVFAGWSGDCSGAGLQTSITMTGGDKNCVATFNPSATPPTPPAPSSCTATGAPSGTAPAPWWSPAPTTAQQYITTICGNGDSTYQAWCAWLTPRSQCVPNSYYAPAVTATPFITVLSPNGGESWQGGTTQTIKWLSSVGISKVNIYSNCNASAPYSGSSDYKIIAENVVSGISGGSYEWYNWNIGATVGVSSGCKVLIKDANNTSTYDYSDAPFSIVAANTITNSITFSRTPATSASLPFKSGDSTTGTYQFTPWSSFQGKNWTLKSRTTDTVTGAVTNDVDFVAGWNDISAQNLCNSSGLCTSTGTFQASQFSCTANTNNVRQREEWIVVNGVESNHNTFYFKCSNAITNNPVTPPQQSACASIGDSCDQQLASAISLNSPVCTTVDKGDFGYLKPQISLCNSSEYTVASGATNWFLIDTSKIPAGGFQFSGSSLAVSVVDYAQGGTGGWTNASVYALDSNNKVVGAGKSNTAPIYMACDNWNCGTNSPLPTALKYLVKITQFGSAVPLSINYHL